MTRAAALALLVACGKEAAPPAPPTPLGLPTILEQTLAGDTTFAATELRFLGVQPDGAFATLVVQTKRRPTPGPFDPKSLYNCPTTTWHGGVPSVQANGTCGMSFDAPLSTSPRCRLAEIWARAREEGAHANGPATITLASANGLTQQGLQWKFATADKTATYPDDCELVVEQGSAAIPRRLPQVPAESPTPDELTRLATAWLREKHPTLVPYEIRAGGIRADGTFDDERGGYYFLPAVIWPADKPPTTEWHLGGDAPYGICRGLSWTVTTGWRIEELAHACRDVAASPRCSVATVWQRVTADGHAGPDARIYFERDVWQVDRPSGQTRARYRERDLACE